MTTKSLTTEFIQNCKKQLLHMKAELVNRARASAQNFSHAQMSRSTSGDEIDQTVAQMEEHSFLVDQERIRTLIFEVEMALARIENGTFGVCEETEEAIEIERLQALPWTRLSIEGAELREALSRKYIK